MGGQDVLSWKWDKRHRSDETGIIDFVQIRKKREIIQKWRCRSHLGIIISDFL